VKLNWLGRATMNNGVRRWGQYYAARWMERLGGRLAGGRVLEVGRGRGVGAQIILERFGAESIKAIDLDPKMIECARRFLGESQHCQWKIAGRSLAKISRAVLSRFSSRQRSLEPRQHPGSNGVFAPAGR
jgi:hypothetical protein